eukprot:453001-Pelagomonas_calceolata.AAC.1
MMWGAFTAYVTFLFKMHRKLPGSAPWMKAKAMAQRSIYPPKRFSLTLTQPDQQTPFLLPWCSSD